ncbi:hypothetical protein [Flavobacterium sp. LHD-85]|uniref:immunoglobulin domain-containing protein n=1 Tax=Flavobacterium sp. LHD-85 TaxID=3071410 RepID=UPI0027E023FC|nr:hypothetical protein [Flavobacterium sp. LHD-85]MDQ6529826.1 hypothetical protein [Flavobacterium sp. LHD-85]
MKKNLFCMWLLLLAIFFSATTQAQMTIGGKKAPEPFSVLELLNKGGLRLPQMTTAQRNAFAVQSNTKGEGLTIYNIDTKCVEYWNQKRWISMCDGTSQATISPEPCIDVAADGSGCDQKFEINDPDCPNGPFNISIVAGGDYASLNDVDNTNGTFKIDFNINESVNSRIVLVRVTSTCTNLYKEFLFSQNGVDCSTMPYSAPNISPSGASLTYCAGGAVYLSVPVNTPNLDKLIWTRNNKEIARGVPYIVVNQKGIYNISMGAVGCNTNAANERNISESGSTASVTLKAFASNNGVLCGTNDVTLWVDYAGTIAWFHNGKEEKTGSSVKISGDSSVGEWFAAVKDGACYSTPSNIIQVTKSEAGGQISLPDADVLVNGKPLKTFTAFCSGGALYLNIANKQAGIVYTWYNGNEPITASPFIVPGSQSKISLRMVATDDSGAQCPAEQQALDMDVINGSTPDKPTINTTSTLCKGKATLTILESGTYTWYKNGVPLSNSTNVLVVDSEGTYGATITNATGCISLMTEKTISGNSSEPNILWDSNVPFPDNASFGSSITVTLTNSYDSSYTWTMDGVKLPNASGKTATIDLPKTGTDGQKVKIAVTAKNECGEKTLEKEVTMNNICPTPDIASISATQTITAKTSVTVNISVNDTNSETYQWFRNSADSTTGGTFVGSGTSYTTADLAKGTYYFYCIVTNGCTGNPYATSLTSKIIVNENPEDMKVGSGTLSGVTCFDIAESNDNILGCGTVPSRLSQKADFTKTYTYTFTPSGTVNNVRFVCIESAAGAGKIVEKVETNGYSVIVTYKTALGGSQGYAKGLATADALKLNVYAVYTDGTGIENAVKLTVQIKDCACCGAFLTNVAGTTEWRNFMCHNLGADQSKDPFAPVSALLGDSYYQGAKSPTVSPGLSGRSGWGNGSGVKTVNDPCPVGYRVPTKDEWAAVVKYNVSTKNVWLGAKDINGSGGLRIGESLMLPAKGAPNILYQAATAYPISYWSSTVAYVLYTNKYVTSLNSSNWNSNADNTKLAVRCIAKKDGEAGEP